MKKFIVKYKDSEKIFGEYISRKEAANKLTDYIHYFNKEYDGEYLSPFDFCLEEVEFNEVNEEITDFDSARNFIGIKSNFDFTVAKKSLSKSVVPIKGVTRLVNEINHKHLEALIALNELFTIAEAWNKADGFVPDFSDTKQYKWLPWFEYNKDTAGFVYAFSTYTTTYADACFGPRLCFMTPERAEQFGKQFADLYNKVFL